MPLQPGTRLGPYEVTAKIGEGSRCEVYQARDTKLDGDVAPDPFTRPAYRSRGSRSPQLRDSSAADAGVSGGQR